MCKRQCRFIFVFILLISISFQAENVLANKFGDITDEEWAIKAPEELPEANAIVLFDEAAMKITTDNIEIIRHKRIKILTPTGAEEAGNQSIWYYDGTDKIKKLKAHTVTPDGKKHKVEKNSIFVKESGKWREKTLAFPVLEAGCIIEYEYTHISKRYVYLRPWYFQGDLYTIRSLISVEIDPGFNYNVTYNKVPFRDRKPVVEELQMTNQALTSGRKSKRFTWDVENLPPITDEPYMSSENDYKASVTFVLISFTNQYVHYEYAKNWSTVGKDFEKYNLKEYNKKNKGVEKLTKEVLKGLSDPREISNALYDYLTNEYKTIHEYNFSYFYNEKLSEFFETKIGSPEEKNYLLTLMHQAAGISCWPTLISRRSNAKINVENPSARQFDYLFTIVEFSDGWEFLDVSDRFSPYGIIPPDCLTNGGLMLEGDKSQLIQLTTIPTLSYRLDQTDMRIDETGVAVCSTKCTLTGYTAALYSQRYEKKEEKDFIDDYFIDRLQSACELGEFDCTLDSNYNFLLNLDFTSGDLAEELDGSLIVKPVSFVYRSNPFKNKKRFFPVDFNYPLTYHNIFNFYVNDEILSVDLPKDFVTEMEGISLIRESSVKDSVVTVAMKLEITDPMFVPAAYFRLRSLFEDLAVATEDEIVVTLSSSK